MAGQLIPSPSFKEPSYTDAIVPLVTLIVLIAGSVALFGAAAVDGPMQVALILSVMVTSCALSSIASPIFILFAVGALIGAWNMSGTIPTLVYYGIITAGAIISGAYVGDKISSLSKTTILAAQLAHVNVHTHIRAAIWTSGPAFLVIASPPISLLWGFTGFKIERILPAPAQTTPTPVSTTERRSKAS